MRCVTLTTDFGSIDGSIASTKAILMHQLHNALPIIDISHHIEPRMVHQAAFILLHNYTFFKKGSIHIVLVDTMYDKNPTMLLAKTNGHYFLVPDNGFLSFAFPECGIYVKKVFVLNEDQSFKDFLRSTADVITSLLQDEYSINKYPNATDLRKANANWLPVIDENSIEAHVIHIDRYENVVLNITKSQIEAAANGRNFIIEFNNNIRVDKVSLRHTDVPISQPLCRYNHAGFLEICVNGGHAATVLGFRLRKENHLLYNIVKLKFIS